ncbi:MAG: NAD-dependent epimerase/dehydratase family protein [Candidatus Hadarchaeales archaeon]
MKVLITGGAGFVGSHLVEALLKSNEVVVLDDLSSGSLSRIKKHFKNEKFSFVAGSILDKKSLEKAAKGVEVIVHEAAIISVPFSFKYPEITRKVNVEGTAKVLQMSLKTGAKMIFASSCAVYGEQKKLPIREDAELNPLSPYAASKAEAEKMCLRAHEKDGLDVTILRYFNIYGPGQKGGPYAGVMIKFMRRIQHGLPPVIFGDGGQTRDFVNVRDVATATELAMKTHCGGEIINVGTGIATSINELCKIFLTLSKKADMAPIYMPARTGEIRHSVADMRKARKLLGFTPAVSLKDGVKELLKGDER